MTRKKKDYCHVAISPEWHEKLKKISAEQKMPMKDIVEELLEYEFGDL